MNEFGVGLSEHPDPAVAAGEAFGAVLEAVGSAPDLAVLFVSAEHGNAFDDLVDAVHNIVQPGVLIGATASTVIGGYREVENAPAVALWAKRSAPGAEAYHLDVADSGARAALVGLSSRPETPATLLALADPFSFPAAAVFEAIADVAPGTEVIGGMASAARRPGENRMVIDQSIVSAGAAAVLVPRVEDLATPLAIVSQGCRPVGAPFIVTAGAGNRIEALGGRSPMERLRELFDAADEVETVRLRSGLQIGKVVDESKIEFDAGDFLVRGISGVDQQNGSITIGDRVKVGETVQFHVRDAATATEELGSLVTQSAEACLLFTCNGRGTHLFDTQNHDANVVQDGVGPVVLAGMACAGEFGPVGGHNFIHTYTASVLLFS